jgi:hypothetical protein
MENEIRPQELTPEQIEKAQEAWLKTERKTALVAAAFGIIIKSADFYWEPWMRDNDLGIPYALGIEMGDIITEGLTPKGLKIIDEAHQTLCERLEVDKIDNVLHLTDLMAQEYIKRNGAPREDLESE